VSFPIKSYKSTVRTLQISNNKFDVSILPLDDTYIGSIINHMGKEHG